MAGPGVFARFAQLVAELAGRPAVFALAAGVIVVWGAVGPLTGYSDTWQLTINTATTIVTFLMVFLIQNTQNRQGLATQLKLDELVRATKGASNRLVDLEDASQRELSELQHKYQKLAERLRMDAGASGDDADTRR